MNVDEITFEHLLLYFRALMYLHGTSKNLTLTVRPFLLSCSLQHLTPEDRDTDLLLCCSQVKTKHIELWHLSFNHLKNTQIYKLLH